MQGKDIMTSDLDTDQASSGDLEVLTFRLGAEEYGIDIQTVQELRGYSAVTQLANAPAYLKGVVNLRGSIVPIIDLRLKLGIRQASYNDFTVVIVLGLGLRTVGVVVDGVSDVVTLKPEQVKPPPSAGAGFDNVFLTGIGTIDDRLLLLVDMTVMLCDLSCDDEDQLAA
jgi:purine-binding chemotaxis protein CheW